MDIAIVNVALPTIRRDLHASVSGLQWTVDAYPLVLASFLLLAGSTADRVGRRRVFQIGLAAFGRCSLLCALAPSICWPTAGRRSSARRTASGVWRLVLGLGVGILVLGLLSTGRWAAALFEEVDRGTTTPRHAIPALATARV